MGTPQWIIGLFSCIDRKDADGFASYLTEESTFQFGNAEPVHGREPIRRVVAQFFASIASVEHCIVETWAPSGTVICRGTATYTRLDSSQLRVPFANILKLEGALIREYLIYVDVSALYRDC